MTFVDLGRTVGQTGLVGLSSAGVSQARRYTTSSQRLLSSSQRGDGRLTLFSSSCKSAVFVSRSKTDILSNLLA